MPPVSSVWPQSTRLTPEQLEAFIEDGFVRIDGAFPRRLANEARAILRRDMGCDPEDPRTWTAPVIRIGGYSQTPFIQAANTRVLHLAFDRLVGAGRWHARGDLGPFSVRFPTADPGGREWRVEPGFGRERKDSSSSRVNVSSKGTALLMLFLFSDVGHDDGPTRLRVGSHRDIARRLAEAGDRGLSLRELSASGFAQSANRPVALATGEAGTVYLCHPFVVHGVEPHRGTRPSFIAQPALRPASPLMLDRPNGDYSAIETAIRRALAAPPD